MFSVFSWLPFSDAGAAVATGASGQPLTVLITGCDTGFGNALAHTLHDRGYNVIAACLTDKAAETFDRVGQSTHRCRGVSLDVTSEEDIERCRLLVEQICVTDGLYCLVNNAGINLGSFIDFTTSAQFAKIMDVNYMGTVRMCKALLSPLRRFSASTGHPKSARIVNVTSASALTPIPGLAAYCASKHASEAFSGALRLELRPWGVKVVTVQPGFAATNIVRNFGVGSDQEWIASPDHIKRHYKNGLTFLKNAKDSNGSIFEVAMDPRKVVGTLATAVAATNPKMINFVGIEPYVAVVANMLPVWLVCWIMSLVFRLRRLVPEIAVMEAIKEKSLPGRRDTISLNSSSM